MVSPEQDTLTPAQSAPDESEPMRGGPPKVGSFYWWTCQVMKVFGWFYLRQEVIHLERFPAEGPVLILATHSSFMDPPVIGAHLPRECHFLAREGIMKTPVIGWICVKVNTHTIRLGASDREAIKTCRSVLKAGCPLVFFPEGTRTRDGRLGPLQRGFAMIVDGMPDVPVMVLQAQDTYKVLRRGWIFPRPHKVRIILGEPAPLPPRQEGERTRDYYDRCALEVERRFREVGAQ